MHRSDDSGTTQNFTDYLSKASGGAWTYPAAGTWPIQGGEAAQGTSGVIGAVQGGNGTIGYADESQAGSLGKALIKVGDAYTGPTPEAAANVLNESKRVEGRGNSSFAFDVARDTTAAGTYPIVLVSYQMACSKYSDAAQANLVKGFLTYTTSAEGQQAAAQGGRLGAAARRAAHADHPGRHRHHRGRLSTSTIGSPGGLRHCGGGPDSRPSSKERP